VEKTEEERNGRPEYKQLKARMKADFKQIRKAVRKHRPLDMELVRAFFSDARLMTTYPGKGDEYCTVFLERVESLAAAAKRGDWAMLQDTVAAVQEMKKQCHKRFK
jgi:XXXCH domain-containing protein